MKNEPFISNTPLHLQHRKDPLKYEKSAEIYIYISQTKIIGIPFILLKKKKMKKKQEVEERKIFY